MFIEYDMWYLPSIFNRTFVEPVTCLIVQKFFARFQE